MARQHGNSSQDQEGEKSHVKDTVEPTKESKQEQGQNYKPSKSALINHLF